MMLWYFGKFCDVLMKNRKCHWLLREMCYNIGINEKGMIKCWMNTEKPFMSWLKRSCHTTMRWKRNASLLESMVLMKPNGGENTRNEHTVMVSNITDKRRMVNSILTGNLGLEKYIWNNTLETHHVENQPKQLVFSVFENTLDYYVKYAIMLWNML